MSFAWHDAIGVAGVGLILLAYFYLQIERWPSYSMVYLTVNLVGSVLITVSLLYDFNLASFVIEIAWIAISLYGMVRSRKRIAIES